MAGSVSQSPRASTRRARKSIAHFPGGSDKENNTISGIGPSAIVKASKKTRSKSIGPGGLDALSETTGNSQKFVPRSILKPTIQLSPIKQIPPRNKSSVNTQASSSRADAAEKDHQQAQQKEAEEARAHERRELQERRDARRKSLANRRVSFAPEATLHTWDLVELAEDATTSSEGANLTRRASSGSTLQQGTITGAPSAFEGPSSDPPSTPPRHEIQVAASPADQRALHQRQFRRDSDAHSVATEDLEAFSSPGDSIASDHVDQSPGRDMELESEDSDEDKDSIADGTVTEGLDADDSIHSESLDDTGSTSSSGRLNRSLRQAVIQGENQDLTLGDDATMDLIEDDTALIPALSSKDLLRTTSQENINPFSPAFSKATSPEFGDGSEMSMDMTMMIGGIINGGTGSPKKGKRKSLAASRRSLARRRSSADSAILADETMDFVTMYGGIQSSSNDAPTTNFGDDGLSMDLTRAMGGVLSSDNIKGGPAASEETEELSMDLTRAIGTVVPANKHTRTTRAAKRASLVTSVDEQTMDFTVANGRLLSPVTEHTEPSENNSINMDITRAAGQIIQDSAEDTFGMDITRAVGAILPKDLKTNDKFVAKQLMEEEADHGQLTRSPFTHKSISRQSDPVEASTSPRKSPRRLNATMPAPLNQTTPLKTPNTPSKQLTPQPDRPGTPSKTPPNPNISMRKTSPKRLFKSSTSKSPKTVTTNLQNSRDLLDSTHKPLVVLTPISRRTSGIGIDQAGLGSPVVAAKLDRRASIGDSTPHFVPGRKGIRFEDPKTMELDLTNLEDFTQAPLEDTTNLRDMIKSLSPKKNKFKGRKSLAPSAKGILGKRPAELDEDEEDATPKKLKSIRSPVKGIRLPGPQRETSTRLSIAPQLLLPTTSITPEPIESEQENHDDRITLQAFLDLTNVRFMDLTTTKRRHTGAVDNQDSTTVTENESLASCVVAGVCTIPTLDLFQHSCRELKKYIAEGRSVVKEIEQDTLEENPALFGEYMAAPSEIREIMDNQFKNIKVHARGESKATWYEWRSKLFEGLKTGLVSIHEGLLRDDKLLGEQEELLHDKVTRLDAQHTLLKSEAKTLQSRADELANCNQDELRSARSQLIQQQEDIIEKKRLLEELQSEFEQAKQAVVEAEERKVESLGEIKEAERVANENRGWTFEEVKILKDQADDLEQQTGWTVQGCNNSLLTFTYQKTVFLSISADLSTGTLQPEQPISLTLQSQNDQEEPAVIQRFFLQYLKARLSTLPYSQEVPKLKSVLDLVNNAWTLAQNVVTETARCRSKFHTTEQIVNDSTLLIQSMILLRVSEGFKDQTKLHVQFLININGDGTHISTGSEIRVKTVYGSKYKEKEMVKFLGQKLKTAGSKPAISGWEKALTCLVRAFSEAKIAEVQS